MSASRWLSGSLLALAMVAGAALWVQRQVATDLRDELALLRDDSRELARLRAENQRLAAALPPSTKLEELRADRAAVVRLRGEIEKSRDNLEKREQALAATAAAPPAPPALVAAIGISIDGNLARDGQRFEPAALRQQLSALPRGSAFEIRLQLPKTEEGVPFDKVKQSVDVIAEHAKQAAQDFGLKLSLRTVAPPK
ncbi:MAG: hypothetical protein Q8N18_14730 [Opitutaceae bacterium]|nr:hypothetical protein [Opitutaceae bacterium]